MFLQSGCSAALCLMCDLRLKHLTFVFYSLTFELICLFSQSGCICSCASHIIRSDSRSGYCCLCKKLQIIWCFCAARSGPSAPSCEATRDEKTARREVVLLECSDIQTLCKCFLWWFIQSERCLIIVFFFSNKKKKL